LTGDSFDGKESNVAAENPATCSPHEILMELVNANHQAIDQGTVQFTMPGVKPRLEAHKP
jgi:hypothetical protein